MLEPAASVRHPLHEPLGTHLTLDAGVMKRVLEIIYAMLRI